MQPPTDRLQTVREIASAQVRLARALACELRAQEPWRQALQSEARGGGKKARFRRLLRMGRGRPAHAALADQLAQVQRCGSELTLWADRARAERRAAVTERERLGAGGMRAQEEVAEGAAGGEGGRRGVGRGAR